MLFRCEENGVGMVLIQLSVSKGLYKFILITGLTLFYEVFILSWGMSSL